MVLILNPDVLKSDFCVIVDGDRCGECDSCQGVSTVMRASLRESFMSEVNSSTLTITPQSLCWERLLKSSYDTDKNKTTDGCDASVCVCRDFSVIGCLRH